MGRALYTLLLTSLIALPAFSEEGEEAPKGAAAVYSITMENDLFGGTDRNYSNGLRIERTAPEEATLGILKSTARLLPGVSVDNQVRQSIALSHAIFTPEDIEAEIPDPEDRPYAGWLNLSFTATSRDDDVEDTLQLNLGVVGPAAGGEYVQVNWHDFINAKETPRGWGSQLEDELGLELIVQRRQLMRRTDLFWDLVGDSAVHYGGSLGNVSTYLNGGVSFRVGLGKDSLQSDYAPPRIRPALAGSSGYGPDDGFGAYFFAGCDLRVVGRDIFLDGNTFRDSASVANRNALVGDLQAGIALQYKNVQLGFTYVHRTEQFQGQNGPQRFGALSLSISR